MRANVVQKRSASITATRYWLPFPRNADSVSKTARPGSVSTRSVKRMSRLSAHRP